MDRDKLAIKVTKIMFKLYNQLVVKYGKGKVIFLPSIKNEKIALNCTPTSFEIFKRRVKEGNSIVRYELSFTLILSGDNKISLLLVISDEEVVKINYKRNTVCKEVDDVLNKIKKIILKRSDKKIEENIVELEKLVEEYTSLEIDFGILGFYEFQKIHLDTDKEYTSLEIDDIKKGVIKKCNERLDYLNKIIFIKIYNNCLWEEEIWEYDFFKDIVFFR